MSNDVYESLTVDLKKAKVGAADMKRLKELLAFVRRTERQPAFQQAGAATVRYIVGLSDEMPTTAGEFPDLEHILDKALHPWKEFGPWDERLIDLWLTKLPDRSGMFVFWLCDQVRENPAADVFQRVRELVGKKIDLTAGKKGSDSGTFLSLSYSVIGEDGRATSIGRWAIEEARADFAKTSARFVYGGPDAAFAQLLAAHAPDLFAAHRKEIKLDERGWSSVLPALLERDLEGNLELAFDVAKKTHDATLLFPYYKAIEKLAPGRLRSLVRAALPEGHRVDSGPRDAMVEWLLQNYGKGALPDLEAGYREPNVAWRVPYLELLVKYLGADAAPHLDKEIRPSAFDGALLGIGKHEYIGKVLALLAPFGISEERRAELARDFAGDTRVQKAIAADVGNANEKGAPKGYAFDDYVETLVTSFADQIGDDPPNGPISALRIYVTQGRSLPEVIVVKAAKQILYTAEAPRSALLRDVDDGMEGDPLEAINEEFDLEDELRWGDYCELPAAILNCELVRAAKRMEEVLRKNGVELAEKFVAELLIDDEDFPDPDMFARNAKIGMKELPKKAAKALLALCYVDPKAGAWLTK